MKKSDEGVSTQAVILAAGMGARLKESNQGDPKCLLPVGGRSLLDHHIEALRSLGIKRILVIAGFGFHKVAEVIPGDVVLKNNDRFSETNSLYSLWMARDWVTDSLIVINSDVLADPCIYQRVLSRPGNVLAYDSTSEGESEEMKVWIEDSTVKAISKDLGRDKMSGENVGILKFDPPGAQELFKAADRLIQSGKEQAWAPAAIDSATDILNITGVDIKDLPWTEIDFPEDLERARERTWPAIADRNETVVASKTPDPTPHL